MGVKKEEKEEVLKEEVRSRSKTEEEGQEGSFVFTEQRGEVGGQPRVDEAEWRRREMDSCFLSRKEKQEDSLGFTVQKKEAAGES